MPITIFFLFVLLPAMIGLYAPTWAVLACAIGLAACWFTVRRETETLGFFLVIACIVLAICYANEHWLHGAPSLTQWIHAHMLR